MAWGNLDPNLIHGSFGPPESTSQMASWSVQLFLQSFRIWMVQSYSPGGANVHHHVMHASLAHLSPQPKWHRKWFGRFCRLTTVTDR